MLVARQFLQKNWKKLVTYGMIDDLVTDTIMDVLAFDKEDDGRVVGLVRHIAHTKAFAATLKIKREKLEPLTDSLVDGDEPLEIPKAFYPATQENDVYVQQVFGWIGKLNEKQSNVLRELADGATIAEASIAANVSSDEALALRRDALQALRKRGVL